MLLFFKHSDGPLCVLPHPGAGTPVRTQRDAERQRRLGQVVEQAGFEAEGPGRETEGVQSPTPASPGLGGPGSPRRWGDQFPTFPICVRGALPKPSDARFLGVQIRSPVRHLHPRRWDHRRFPLGERSAAPGTAISPVCSARRSLCQNPEPTLPAPQRRAGVPTPGGDARSPRRACGAQCAWGPAASTPGRASAAEPRRVRALGPPHQDRLPFPNPRDIYDFASLPIIFDL